MDIQNNAAQNSSSEPIVARSGLDWKKILIIGVLISALGGIAYFASTTSLFSGDIFRKDFKAKSIEDFFPVEAEDFTKIKIGQADSNSELLAATWKTVISKYLQNQTAFPEDQLLKLSQGKDLEILAASWNSGKNNLVAAKLDAETLSHLVANIESENTYYVSVLDAGESRLIAARAEKPRDEVTSAASVTAIHASSSVNISAAALQAAAAAQAAEEAAAAQAAEEAAAAQAAAEAAAAQAAAEAAAAQAAAEAAAAQAAAEAAAAQAAAEAAAAQAAAEAAKQKALCNPQKNFCIVGDYLLLGNSIELAAEITTRPATKKISAKLDYKKLNAQLRKTKSGLINGRDKIFLATIAEIKTYYSGTSNPATPAETSENVSEQEVLEIDKIGPQIQEIKDQLATEVAKTETASQQALNASAQLAGQASDGDKYTLEATTIYDKAHLEASNKSKEAVEALKKIKELLISDDDFKVIQTALGKAKEYAQAAKTHDEAIQQLTAAQKFLTDAQAKLTDAKKQTTIAEEASLQVKEILLAAENAVQALGDAAFKKIAEEEKEVPKYLLDQWDPQDDQISGATLISFPAEAVAEKEYLDNMHLFSPSSNEKTDWYKMTVSADKKYTFTSNGPDKVQIDLASSSNDASCSATGTKEILATGKVVYTAKNNETICISASTSQGDNISYALSYKFQNVAKVPITEGLPPATEVKMTTSSAGQQMKIAVEGTEKVEVLRVDFAGISEKVTIDELQLAIASIEKAFDSPDIPVKELFIYNSENTLLAKCTPDKYGLALCSEIGFKVDAGQKNTMIVKADMIPLSTVNSSDKVKTGTVFNVAIKSIIKAYKQNPSFKATIETRAPLKCASTFISYNSKVDIENENFSPKCGNEIMPGDIIFVDKKEYILITDKKSTESQETVALTHKQYGSSFFFGNTNLATNSEKLLAHGALIMFRASKPVITTVIYPGDKKISKNLAKGIYQFNLSAEKNALSVGRIVFEVEGQLGGIKIGQDSNLTDSYVVDKDHYINLKNTNGLTAASIEKFDLAYVGGDGQKLPAEFKYYYDEKADKGYVFADLLEDLKIDTSITQLELKAKITGDLIDGDFLTVKIPAVLNSSQLITETDLPNVAQKAAYLKSMTKTLQMTKRTLFPDFVDPDFYEAMDDAEKAKIITKFFLYDDFIWSDRDQELRDLIGTMNKFYFDANSSFIGGYMLDSLPTEEQTLYY